MQGVCESQRMNDPFEIEEMLIRAATEFSDAEERARFLGWACRGDDGLRVRMNKLLSIQESSDRFFDFKPFEITDEKSDDLAADAADEGDGGEIGLRIGRYRLIRRLGEGGCGVVYQAEQEQPVRRHVALKLIRVGLDHARVIERFEMERQALAMMDHPGIARVLDAGATPTGRPFFVMQWVTGEPITGFCEKNRLSIRQRLELFIRVCHAIQHAHQKGVIHRDIKPSNVLASFHDGVPLPKVIDFGIAMATGGGLAEPDGEPEPILGTPNYMSPEQGQRGGLDVDTRTDIFSLGVLLCEILVGKTPFGPAEPTIIHTGELTACHRQPAAKIAIRNSKRMPACGTRRTRRRPQLQTPRSHPARERRSRRHRDEVPANQAPAPLRHSERAGHRHPAPSGRQAGDGPHGRAA